MCTFNFRSYSELQYIDQWHKMHCNVTNGEQKSLKIVTVGI